MREVTEFLVAAMVTVSPLVLALYIGSVNLIAGFLIFGSWLVSIIIVSEWYHLKRHSIGRHLEQGKKAD